MRRFATTVRDLWTRFLDLPRKRPLYVFVYVVLALGGVSALVAPPQSITSTIHPALAYAFFGLLTLGGAIGAVTVFTRWWRLERIGIGFASIGAGVYLFVTIVNQFNEQGNRSLQIAFLIVVTLLLFGRFAEIRDWEYEPRPVVE